MPIAIIGAGVIGAGASIYSGYMGSKAAKDAASIQANAAKDIAAQQMQVNQQAFSPWMGIGQNAYQSLAQLYGVATPGNPGGGSDSINQGWSHFLNTPAYQFAVQQGNLGLDRTAASKGLLLSGGQLRDAQSFNQGLATQQIGNYTNVLQSMSNMGLQASAGYAGQFNQAANTLMGGANAQAAGVVGSANAMGAGLSGASNNLLLASLGGGRYANNNNTTNNPSSYQPLNISPNGISPTSINSNFNGSYGQIV